MFGLGTGELVVIFVIVFLLFGPKALPDIAKNLGKAIRMFKKESNDIVKSLEDSGENQKVVEGASGDQKKENQKNG